MSNAAVNAATQRQSECRAFAPEASQTTRPCREATLECLLEIERLQRTGRKLIEEAERLTLEFFEELYPA